MRWTLVLFAALGAVAQQPGPADMPQEMVWVDPTGKILGRAGAVQNSIFFPEISPDGKWIAVSARDGVLKPAMPASRAKSTRRAADFLMSRVLQTS